MRILNCIQYEFGKNENALESGDTVIVVDSSIEKKNDLYNACDIYIMNSHKTNQKGDSEGFGITFLESNACGKPIIGTNSGGIADAIKHRVNGLLIEPNQPSATAEAIFELFNDKELYAYGVYQIEADGRSLFSKIDGDEDTIMGLSLIHI